MGDCQKSYLERVSRDKRSNTHDGHPSNARRTLRNSREMVEPFPVLPVRLLGASDRLDVLLERPEQLLKLALVRLLARARDEQQLAEVLELLLNQPDLPSTYIPQASRLIRDKG